MKSQKLRGCWLCARYSAARPCPAAQFSLVHRIAIQGTIDMLQAMLDSGRFEATDLLDVLGLVDENDVDVDDRHHGKVRVIKNRQQRRRVGTLRVQACRSDRASMDPGD